jgi:crotonobetainyl-CoA:carnitine CoA-transferase CaiB-like acyl-CoA transferase
MTPMDQLAETLDIPELASYEPPETYEQRDEIKRTLESYTRTQQTDELLDTLVEADIWAARVQTFEEAAEHPQVQHNDMIVNLAHPTSDSFATTGIPGEPSATLGEIQYRPPNPGEHTEEILTGIGYSGAEIQKLEEQGVTTI